MADIYFYVVYTEVAKPLQFSWGLFFDHFLYIVNNKSKTHSQRKSGMQLYLNARKTAILKMASSWSNEAAENCKNLTLTIDMSNNLIFSHATSGSSPPTPSTSQNHLGGNCKFTLASWLMKITIEPRSREANARHLKWVNSGKFRHRHRVSNPIIKHSMYVF